MRTQFAAFLEDPEGYDQRRQMCDRVALAKACIAEIDEGRRQDDLRRSALFAVKSAADLALGTFPCPVVSSEQHDPI